MVNRTSVLLLGVFVLLPLAGRAAEETDGIKVLLPADTQQYLVVNMKQFLASEIAKQHLDEFKKMVAQPYEDNFLAKLAKLGINPLRDVDRIVFVGPASLNFQNPTGTIILCGSFDSKKVLARAKEIAEQSKGKYPLIVRDGPHDLINLTESNLYAATAGGKFFIAGSIQEEVRAALDRVADQKQPVVKDKEVLKSLTTIDPGVSFFSRFHRNELKSPFSLAGAFERGHTAVGKLIAKVHSIRVEVRCASDVKFAYIVEMPDKDTANMMKARIATYLDYLKLLVKALDNDDNSPLKRLYEMMEKNWTLETKDRSVIVRGSVPPEALEILVSESKYPKLP